MKFDCGDDGKAEYERLSNWHPWFAWYPVKIADHDCRWFERVERRGKYILMYGWLWQYRPVAEACEK